MITPQSTLQKIATTIPDDDDRAAEGEASDHERAIPGLPGRETIRRRTSSARAVVLGTSLEPALDDRPVADEEAEHEERQCRNWQDHAAFIDPASAAVDPWNEDWERRAVRDAVRPIPLPRSTDRVVVSDARYSDLEVARVSRRAAVGARGSPSPL